MVLRRLKRQRKRPPRRFHLVIEVLLVLRALLRRSYRPHLNGSQFRERRFLRRSEMIEISVVSVQSTSHEGSHTAVSDWGFSVFCRSWKSFMCNLHLILQDIAMFVNAFLKSIRGIRLSVVSEGGDGGDCCGWVFALKGKLNDLDLFPDFVYPLENTPKRDSLIRCRCRLNCPRIQWGLAFKPVLLKIRVWFSVYQGL